MKKRKIQYDEEKQAIEILSSIPKQIRFSDISILCKYYYDLGLDTKKVKQKVFDFYSKFIEESRLRDGFYIDLVIQKSKMFKLKKSANIAITKKEIEVLKNMSHKDYKVALYILFLVKLEKFQSINKLSAKKRRSFKYLLWHDIRSCAFTVGVSLSETEGFEMLNRFYKAGFAEPTLMSDYQSQSPIIVKADSYNGRNVEFVIEGKKDFIPQVIYYCVKCKNKTEKYKHDFCASCYAERRREYKTAKQKEYRNVDK